MIKWAPCRKDFVLSNFSLRLADNNTMADFLQTYGRIRDAVANLGNKLAPDLRVESSAFDVDGDGQTDFLTVEPTATEYIVRADLTSNPDRMPGNPNSIKSFAIQKYSGYTLKPKIAFDREAQRLTIGEYSFQVAGDLSDEGTWAKIGNGIARVIPKDILRIASQGIPGNISPLRIVFGSSSDLEVAIEPWAKENEEVKDLLQSVKNDWFFAKLGWAILSTRAKGDAGFFLLHIVKQSWFSKLFKRDYMNVVNHEAIHVADYILSSLLSLDPSGSETKVDPKSLEYCKKEEGGYDSYCLDLIPDSPNDYTNNLIAILRSNAPRVDITDEDKEANVASNNGTLVQQLSISCDPFRAWLWEVAKEPDALPTSYVRNIAETEVKQGALKDFPQEWFADTISQGIGRIPEDYPRHYKGAVLLYDLMQSRDPWVLENFCENVVAIMDGAEKFTSPPSFTVDEPQKDVDFEPLLF